MNGSSEGLIPYRYTRRLSDKILLAYEQACDFGLAGMASELLRLFEEQIYRENTYPGRERRNPDETLLAAQKRLFQNANAATLKPDGVEEGWPT